MALGHPPRSYCLGTGSATCQCLGCLGKEQRSSGKRDATVGSTLAVSLDILSGILSYPRFRMKPGTQDPSFEP
jgi:hypothetical protein